MNEWMNEWINEWRNESGSMSEWINGWIWMNVDERKISELMNEWMCLGEWDTGNEWIKEWMGS